MRCQISDLSTTGDAAPALGHPETRAETSIHQLPPHALPRRPCTHHHHYNNKTAFFRPPALISKLIQQKRKFGSHAIALPSTRVPLSLTNHRSRSIVIRSVRASVTTSFIHVRLFAFAQRTPPQRGEVNTFIIIPHGETLRSCHYAVLDPFFNHKHRLARALFP